MAEVATITIGSSTYNVYSRTSDVMADAKSYFAGHISGLVWTAASTATKHQALITGFRILERQRWEGAKQVPSQTTKFPRTGLDCDGEDVADGTPDEIAEGEYELALILIQDPTVATSRNSRSDVKRAKADVAEVEFFRAPLDETTVLPAAVFDLVGCFLSGTDSDAGLPFVSGSGEDTIFTVDDEELTDGYA